MTVLAPPRPLWERADRSPAANFRLDPAESADAALSGAAETRLRNHRLSGLLHAAGRGDRAAFTEFYRATSARVFGLAVRILRNGTVAEEIAQEVYLQAWTLAGRYDESLSSPMGWLMMLTHRRAVDRIRADQSARGREVVYGRLHRGRDHDSVTESVEQRFDEESVLACLGRLTDKQREAITLAYYSGRTYSEVAEYLNVPLPTVKTRIREGLKRLEQHLKGRDIP